MRAADCIVRGRIATFGGTTGCGWVEAIAITDGVVVAAGAADDVEPLAGTKTRRLDLPPDTVALPGLIDAHLHLVDAALAARQLDLEGLGPDDALALIATASRALHADEWLLGAGWDHRALQRWPAAADLDRVAPGRFVLLWSHDRHALWVSDPVLRLAGIDAERSDPPGGAIRREDDGTGRPTGVLHESAASLALPHVPAPAPAGVEAATLAYAEALLRLGVTGLHDPGGLDAHDLGAAAIAGLGDRGRLPIRVHRSVRPPGLAAAIAAGLRTGAPLGDDPGSRARMGWLKLFADGALGSRTALLIEPDLGGGRGTAVTEPGELRRLAASAMAAGIVPQVHAIGDAALRVALAALEPIAPPTGPMARVEHVQLARADDLPRLAAARIGASVQPIHLRTDRDKAIEAWGAERSARDSFRARSLLAAGAVVAIGTDAPVEPADPWPGIALAVTRRAASWADGRPFAPHEAIDLVTALRAATVGPATVAGEPAGGRLVTGSRADLIVIPASALDDPVESGGELERTRPSIVLVDGAVAVEA